MKIGDLVEYKNLHGHVVGGTFISKTWTGIVIEVGVYTGNKDIIVLWSHGGHATESRHSLQIISPSR
ncbi:MAG: hypothetical protein H8E12_11255 [Rhodobacteraceae bacterium]|nr:hypothetical protein [Paracoccaceae bacterium]